MEANGKDETEKVVENQGLEVNTGQDLILRELKNISQKFGQLESQAAKDREVLANLVSKVNQQAKGTLNTQVTTSATTSLFSPKTVIQIVTNIALERKVGQF